MCSCHAIIRLIGCLLVIAIFISAALVCSHTNDLDRVGTAFGMMVEDYRVAATCPTKPGTVIAFIGRSPYGTDDSRMSIRFADGWEAQVCSGDRAYEQPTGPGEVEEPTPAVTRVVAELSPPNTQSTATPEVQPTVGVPVRRSVPTPTSNAERSAKPAALATPTPRQVPDPTSTSPLSLQPTATPPPTVAPSPTSIPPPPLRHLVEKQFMLELINEERAGAGLDPVVLGDNAAAQLHAEASLENCFSSHWGIDGLKPYMRYSLAGGYQSNGENGSGLDYCIKASDGYRAIGSSEQGIRTAMEGWMTSPGHRDNILDPWHKKVNIGLAWDRFNFMAYQHFEGDYVEYEQLPVINKGILRITGTLKNGAQFDNSLYSGVQVYYDQPPQTLSKGQVTRTYCYDFGLQVASLRPPLTGRSYYPTHEFTQTYQPCPDPYDVSASASAPRSYNEAHSIWLAVYGESRTRPSRTITVPWITALEWADNGNEFSTEADLSDVLAKHGDGVYSVVIWGGIDGEDAVISEFSMFHGVTPPDTYDPGKYEGR